MFTSKERVIRDGYLIAFEGETMSEEEAAKRGLLAADEEKPKRKTTRKTKPKPEPVEDEAEEDYDEDEES